LGVTHQNKEGLSLDLGEHVGNARVRVRLGIEHGTSNTSASEEEHGTSHHEANSPWRQQRRDSNHGLLSSVAEVVVSGAHVIESASLVHSDQTTIKVWSWGSIQFHAVLLVRLGIVGVVVVLGQQLSLREAASLIQEGHVLSQPLRFEQRSVVGQPGIGGWVRLTQTSNLDDVRSVGLIGTLTSVACRIGVAASPLEVDVVAGVDVKVLRSNVVLRGRIGLHDVASLASHVQVVDLVS